MQGDKMRALAAFFVCNALVAVSASDCTLAKDFGEPCGSHRFYYCKHKQRCIKFWYKGRNGNDNNFETKEECDTACPADEVCMEPRGKGHPCYAKRFYFDTTTRTCREFTYHGTKGNSNNYGSKEECEQTCSNVVNPISQPSIIGGDGLLRGEAISSIMVALPIVQTFRSPRSMPLLKPPPTQITVVHEGPKALTSPCETGGGENCIESKDMAPDCISDKDLGNPCGSHRFYYCHELKSCVQFWYKGRYGNENNFETIGDCESQCPGSDICLQPKDEGGACFQTRFFYDMKSKKCKGFLYKGTKGNHNNYKKKRECKAKCMG